VVVLVEDFEAALEKAAPSVSKVQTRRYEALRETFGRVRACGVESTKALYS